RAIGVISSANFVQRLRGSHAFFNQPFGAPQLSLIDPQLSLCLVDFRLGTHDLFGTRAALKFLQPGLCGFICSPCLLELCAILAVLEPHDNLVPSHAIAFFNSDPSDAACDLRANLNLVMSNDVACGNENSGLG